MSAGGEPVEQHLPLRFGEAEIVLELAVLVDGLPWRHDPLCHHALDVGTPGFGGFVGVECEGGDVAGAVAALALFLEETGDLFGVSDLRHGQWRQREQCE
jgi:hypothetical protein